MDLPDLKKFLIALIDEEFGPNPITIGPKWEGGTLILKPSGDQQAKEIPIEVFFKKITSIRDNLRVLEQKLNTLETLTPTDKATLQGYITKSYGTLTSFNILFKNDKDKFVGVSSGQKKSEDSIDGLPEKLTVGEARRRLGLREHGE